MIKELLLISILAACVLIGLGISNYYRKRKIFYADTLQFCEELLNEVNFMQTKLINMAAKSAGKYKSALDDILAGYQKYLNNQVSFEEFKIGGTKFTNFLSDDERDQLFEFLKSVGGLDVENESNNIRNYIIAFKRRVEDSIGEHKKYYGLYIKMSIIVGLALVVLLV